MTDTIEQTVTDTLRLAAKSAAPYSTAMIGASHLNEAADTIDNLRAQLAEAQRELIAKEAERAGLELERNNAQRQHTMQCAINKTDSQRILELTAQLAEAQRDAERYRAIKDERVYIECPNDTEPKWYVYGTTAEGSYVTGADLDAAIDAAKGKSNEPT